MVYFIHSLCFIQHSKHPKYSGKVSKYFFYISLIEDIVLVLALVKAFVDSNTLSSFQLKLKMFWLLH